MDFDIERDYSKLSDEELITLERAYNDEAARLNSIQMALKINLNSLYGALGNGGFRYFDVSLASSVTASGRHAIRWIERKLNELIDKMTGISKDRVVLIDTDSVVLDLSDVVSQRCPEHIEREKKLQYLDVLSEKILHPYIAASYDELGDYMNAYKHKFRMKRENIINSMISVAAKNYVMEVYNSEGVQYTLDNPYMKIMGLPGLVKSSTPQVVRKSLRNALPIMLHGTEAQLWDWLDEEREKYNNYSIEEIAFPRGITDLSKYDPRAVRHAIAMMNNEDAAKAQEALERGNDVYVFKTPIHVRGSLLHNHLIDKLGMTGERNKISDGDKIKFVYLREPNPINSNVIAFQDTLPSQFKLDNYVDYNMMFEKTFLSAIETMISPMGWRAERTNTLDDWFAF